MRLNAKDLAHLTLVSRPPLDGVLPGPAGLFLWSADERVVPPRLRSAFSRGHWLSGVKLLFPDSHGVARPASRDGWWLDAGLAAAELATIPLSHLAQLSPSVGVWALASKWALELVMRQQLVPTLIDETRGEARGKAADVSLCRAQWRVAPVRPEDRARLYVLADALPSVARSCPIPNSNGTTDKSPLVRSAIAALQEFVDAAVDGLMRAPTQNESPVQARPGSPWHLRLAAALAGPQPTFELRGVAESHLPSVLTQWASPAVGAGTTGRPVVGYRISEPRSSRGAWLLSYHLYPASSLVPHGQIASGSSHGVAGAGGAGGPNGSLGVDGAHVDMNTGAHVADALVSATIDLSQAQRVAASDLAGATAGVREVIAKMVEPEETLLDALGRCALHGVWWDVADGR